MGIPRLRGASPSTRRAIATCLTAGFAIASFGSTASLHAQHPHSVSYRDGQRTCVVTRTLEIDAFTPGLNPVMVQCRGTTGPHFRAWVGTDALITFNERWLAQASSETVNAWLETHHLQLEERLLRDVWRVRSTALPEADRLASSLISEVQAGVLDAASPDLSLIHRSAAIALPPNDPRYGGQWYLARIGIEAAWALSSGDPSTTIAIIDNGCDLVHPDLAAHLRQGYDALDDDDVPSFDPARTGNEHGTACAGIVAAVPNNEIGIVGVCPECSISCIRLINDAPIPVSSDIRAFEFALEEGHSVLSNSWGFEEDVAVPFALRRVIERVMEQGRGGLGAVVVFAAGNDAGLIGDDELQAIPGLITVGATTNFDETAAFSNRGACLALAAPTGTLTTDISGAEGESPTDYTSRFGGTSSSAPVVAGVAALLLSHTPSLTQAEVREILIRTARPAPFATPDAMGHDLHVGYGIIDPAAALGALFAQDPDAGRLTDAGVAESDASVTPTAPPGGCVCTAQSSSQTPIGGLTFMTLLGAALTCRWTQRRLAAGLMLLLAVGCDAPSPRPTQVSVEQLRPNSPGSEELPPRYDVADVVEHLDSVGGSFRVHFTRAGRHAVRLTDVDANGTPDDVEVVARTYDDVLLRYASMGFRVPPSDVEVPDDNGGDGRFDVYLVDFAVGADGSYRRERCGADGCAGYMLQENDFSLSRYPSYESGTRLLAAHEFFHAVQAGYEHTGSVPSSVLSEGTAVWASEQYDSTLNDLEGFTSAYLARTDRSLGTDPIGAAVSTSYGAGVFFDYLETDVETGVVLDLLERQAHASAPWLVTLAERLEAAHGTTFAAVFLRFAIHCATLGRPSSTPRLAAFPRLMPVLVTSRLEDESVRFFPAGFRSFELRSGLGEAISLRVDASELTRQVVFLEESRVVHIERDAGDRVEVPVEATGAIVLIADARVSGSSVTSHVCIDVAPDGCAPLEGDAGVADVGAADAASLHDDAGSGPPPRASCSGCRVGGVGVRASWLPWGVLMLGWLVKRRPMPVRG